jgi:hypothetical protein
VIWTGVLEIWGCYAINYLVVTLECFTQSLLILGSQGDLNVGLRKIRLLCSNYLGVTLESVTE